MSLSRERGSQFRGGLSPGGVSVQVGLCPGGVCPGGVLSRGISVRRGRGSLSWRLRYIKEWAVRILLECLLVFYGGGMISEFTQICIKHRTQRLLFFVITDNQIEPDKRGDKLLPVAFQCSRPTAVCRNHGRGPKVTMSRKRRGAAMCVCLCPPGYTRPQCARKNKPAR